jgi:hypothetical protein
MDDNTLRVMTSSANEHWNTPAVVRDPILTLGKIKLDPCSNPGSILGAETEFYGPGAATNAQDGLLESWQCGGLVFVNPPYGRKIVPWITKCAREADITRTSGPGFKAGTEIILLGPARTDTKWFQLEVLPTADSVLLWKGRLTFEGAPAPAVFPSFLAYWGHRPGMFRQAFAGKGWCT